MFLTVFDARCSLQRNRISYWLETCNPRGNATLPATTFSWPYLWYHFLSSFADLLPLMSLRTQSVLCPTGPLSGVFSSQWEKDSWWHLYRYYVSGVFLDTALVYSMQWILLSTGKSLLLAGVGIILTWHQVQWVCLPADWNIQGVYSLTSRRPDSAITPMAFKHFSVSYRQLQKNKIK